VVNGCIQATLRGSLIRPATGRHGRGHRTRQMRSRLRTLSALEVAVRRRHAAGARRHDVVVDGEAHRAATFAPFETGVAKDPVQPFAFGGTANCAGAGHDQRANARGNTAAVDGLRCGAKVGNAAVGARSDENHVDGRPLDALAFRQSHVGQRGIEARSPFRRHRRAIGYAPIDADHVAGVVPQVICGASDETSRSSVRANADSSMERSERQ
jgi:hypothetical protein